MNHDAGPSSDLSLTLAYVRTRISDGRSDVGSLRHLVAPLAECAGMHRLPWVKEPRFTLSDPKLALFALLVFDRARAMSRVHSRAMTRALDGGLGGTLDRIGARLVAVDHALDRERVHVRALDTCQPYTRLLIRLRVSALLRELELAYRQACSAEASVTTAVRRRGAGEHGGSASARRVACWSARMLPMAHRARYHDEFVAELFDLQAKPRLTQLAYALRLLARSVGLRRALRHPMPPAFGQERAK